MYRRCSQLQPNICRPCRAPAVLLSVCMATVQPLNLPACTPQDRHTNELTTCMWSIYVYLKPQKEKKNHLTGSWYNSPADNPLSSTKRAKVVEVLHGLRGFSTAEHGWHFGVKGQRPGVSPFGVMIVTSWDGLLRLRWKKNRLYFMSVLSEVLFFLSSSS